MISEYVYKNVLKEANLKETKTKNHRIGANKPDDFVLKIKLYGYNACEPMWNFMAVRYNATPKKTRATERTR